MMKLAIIGSRSLHIENLERYLPDGVTEIVSGGAKGVDTCAREYANTQKLKLTEFYPDYAKYGRSAPLKRNLQIIAYADILLIFGDGISKGTRFVIENSKKQNKKIILWQLSTSYNAKKSCIQRDVPGCFAPSPHDFLKKIE